MANSQKAQQKKHESSAEHIQPNPATEQSPEEIGTVHPENTQTKVDFHQKKYCHEGPGPTHLRRTAIQRHRSIVKANMEKKPLVVHLHASKPASTTFVVLHTLRLDGNQNQALRFLDEHQLGDLPADQENTRAGSQIPKTKTQTASESKAPAAW